MTHRSAGGGGEASPPKEGSPREGGGGGSPLLPWLGAPFRPPFPLPQEGGARGRTNVLILTQIEGREALSVSPFIPYSRDRRRRHSITPFRGQMRSMEEEEESSGATDENVLLNYISFLQEGNTCTKVAL